MNQTTRQSHQLHQQWEAQDYAAAAQQSAAAAQQYHQLTDRSSQLIRADLERMNQQIQIQARAITQLKNEFGSSRTHCLIWGAGGAMISAIAINLILAPFNAPPAPMQNTIAPMQYESAPIQEFPQVQPARKARRAG